MNATKGRTARTLLLLALCATLGGCVVAPRPYYGHGYGYGGYGHGYGYSGGWGGRGWR